MPASIKYHKANIKSAIGRIRRGEHLTGLADGRVRVPLSSYLNHPCAGYDSGARGRRRNAAGTLAASHLLGARHLDRQPLPVPRDRLVDLLPLARPAAVEFLPFSFRPDLPNNFVFGVTPTLSA